tara:strand:+ start:591 stop:2093 length:1503 start_codon:yes stop_codon:yes gene_type:complete
VSETAVDTSDEALSSSLFERERVLLSIDNQLISLGLRLTLLLPAFSLFILLGAWAYDGTDPNWWESSIKPSVQQSFSSTLLLLGTVIGIGWLLTLGIHRYRIALSHSAFVHAVKASENRHQSIEALHGYDGMAHRIQKQLRMHSLSFTTVLIALIGLGGVLLLGLATSLGENIFLASWGMLLLALGFHMNTRQNRFNMVNKSGLLDAFEPPVHPSTLEGVFDDMIRTHLDPLLCSQYDELMRKIQGHVKRGVKHDFAREKVLMTLYRHYNGLDSKTVRLELEEVLKEDGADILLNDTSFTLELWLELIEHAQQQCPAFFRLIDRIEQDMEFGRDPALKDLVFEVDLENVVTKRANLFVFMHNLSKKSRTVVFRVQSPDFRPNQIAMRYQLAPGKEVWWSSDALPIAVEGNEDVLGKMTGLLRDGTMAWQTLLPQRFGEATVSVRLEEVSGDLLIGRQINVNVRNEFQQRLRRIITLSAQVLGAAVIGLASVLELLEIFNV